MKIAFFSNFYNNHLSEFCKELFNLTQGNFIFIEKGHISPIRVKMGFNELKADFVKTFASLCNKDIEEIIKTYDVVIVGSESDDIYKKRLKSGKLLFKMSEHPFKGEIPLIKKNLKRLYWRFKYKNKPNSFMLAASSRCVMDFSKSAFCGRILNFGYFPPVISINRPVPFNDRPKNSIIWVGRMIWWKHPEIAVLAVKRLVEDGFDVKCTMVGADYEFENIKKLVASFSMENHVCFTGLKSQEEVLYLMHKNRYFLFTSDSNEGWGAVLNEAMNSSCVCLASKEAGSSKILIDGCNGLLVENRADKYYELLKSLLTSNGKINETLSDNAFNTITKSFNGKIAAQRLFEFCKNYLKNGEPSFFEDGILSRQLE